MNLRPVTGTPPGDLDVTLAVGRITFRGTLAFCWKLTICTIYAAGKGRGHLFDGTCNGDGTGGRGQSISEILRTLTITITEWTYSTLSPTPTHHIDDHDHDAGRCDGHCDGPRSPSTTVTRIVTVTNLSASGKRVSSSFGRLKAGGFLVAVISGLMA